MRFGWIAGGVAAVVCVAAMAQGPKELRVPLLDSHGADAGFVTFKTVKKGVKMHIELKNLAFGEHAVHIHQHAVCDAPDFKGAGGHFNPAGMKHGWENPAGHHNGDLPKNVMVDENHMGSATFVLNGISLDPSAPNSVFADGGTAVVVHEHADDMKTDPTGNAGNRVACGVVKQ